jgi:hypothetical protein
LTCFSMSSVSHKYSDILFICSTVGVVEDFFIAAVL